MGHRILVGDVRERLKQLEPDSIHCVVTSPPYYGLRSYHTKPQIWGGNQDCAHKWTDPIRRTGGSGRQGQAGQRASRTHTAELVRDLGIFCGRCWAWQGEHGREPSMHLWLSHQVDIWREIRRVLRKDGVAFLNIGDAYANDGKWGGKTSGKHADHLDEVNTGRVGREKRHTGLTPKNRMLLPERLIIALQDDGWTVRDQVIWSKPNPMPSSVTDRTTPAHELLYVITKRAHYYWDAMAIAEPATYDGPNSPGSIRSPYGQGFTRAALEADTGGGRAAGNKRHKFTEEFLASVDPQDRPKARLLDVAHTAYPLRNKRSVWSIATEPFPEAHFATFPTALVAPCILAGTSHRGACPTCGAPWERIERVSYSRARTNAGKISATVHHDGGSGGYEMNVRKDTLTLGWYPACRCAGLPALPKCPVVKRKRGDSPAKWQKRREQAAARWQKAAMPYMDKTCGVKTERCIVLDPFAGAGTTLLVADRLGRASIGIELNPDFARMALNRLQGESSLFSPAGVEE